MEKITFDNVEEKFGSILPIIGMLLILSFISFMFGYFVGNKEGYYEGTSYVYEKILKERSLK